MKIKVCGLRQTENIKELTPIQPDYMGFIFYKKSKRYAEGILDIDIINSSNFNKFNIKKTGVFVNAEFDTIKEAVKKYDLNTIQLHGDESADFCRHLQSTLKIPYNLEIIKVFSVDDYFDFSTTKKFEAVSDFFLFDTKGKERGGNGITFNWDVLKGYKGENPFFLSGGIRPIDALIIKNINHPKLYGVDINSCFEVEPGLKDVRVVERFISELRT